MKTKEVIQAVFAALVVCLSFPPGADAGSSRVGSKTYFETDRVIRFSNKVEKFLEQKQARAAILARVGIDRGKLPEGILFTHIGFAVHSQIAGSPGRKNSRYAIHNLYQRDGRPWRSDLIRDFPADFFSGARMLEAGIIIPGPELQKRLTQVISSDFYQDAHNSHYSTIANPFTLDMQNCTEHTLDIVFAAMYQTTDMAEIKRNQKKHFIPHPIRVNPLTLSIGAILIPGLSTSDHPGPPVTATFGSIGRFFKEHDPASRIYMVREKD
ncbi:conserved hypothetical protein [Candidatus Desulfarcum epimagneticum]|uniref:DUF2145 domain-containing protein n=1 Tax=uncultured Desulfobacteraceae bacterium TaxID=218296 RepID=A0A484HGI2_9BACT|nr:conserved hypothetical protein [uncultured Desulfobacteraceae bacterium]